MILLILHLQREGDLRARTEYFCAFVLVGLLPVSAAAARAPTSHVVPAETISAAAIPVVAPFGLITSTFRTVEHNRAVGGVPDSYHLLGRAIDIVRKRGVSHAEIAAALTRAGFKLIESLDEGDHSHFAFGPTGQKTAGAVPPPSILPAKNILAADQHGTLKIDLAASTLKSRAKTNSATGDRHAIH